MDPERTNQDMRRVETAPEAGQVPPKVDGEEDWFLLVDTAPPSSSPGWPAQVWHRSLPAAPMVARAWGARLPELTDADAAAVQGELDAHMELDRAAAAVLGQMLLDAAAWVASNFDPVKTELSRPDFLQARLRRAVGMFFSEISPRAARRAYSDQVQRDRARDGGDEELVHYIDEHALCRLDQLRRQAKSWWHVPGMTYEDLRETARVELVIEFLEDGLQSRERPGLEATVRFFYSLRRKLRSEARTFLWEQPYTVEYMRRPTEVPTAEEALIANEEKTARHTAVERALPHLTRLQRRWLEAFRSDIEQNGELCLARAATSLGRSRAAASLARKAIQQVVDLHRTDRD